MLAFGEVMTDDELAKKAHPHPISGPLTFGQRLAFLGFHIDRHRGQLEITKTRQLTSMKITIRLLLIQALFMSCGAEKQPDQTAKESLPIVGTWRLLSGTTIEKGDTVVTDYTKNLSFIKIINDTHFAFVKHDLTNGKGTADFGAGGGRYVLTDSAYTEHLEYCNDRQWEGHDFAFTITLKNDTLTQTGVEKVPDAGIDRLNIEQYVRVKP